MILRPTHALLAMAAAAAAASPTTEIVGLVSAGGGGPPGPPNLLSNSMNWCTLAYEDENLTSAANVTLTESTTEDAPDEIWVYSIESPTFELSGRYWDNKIYGYTNVGNAPSSGGCCSDSFTIYSESNPSGEVVDLTSIISPLFPNAVDSYAYPTHTFDIVKQEDGSAHAYLMVQYEDADINALADAVVVLDVDTLEVIPTADGSKYFSFLESANAGTMSTTKADTIFRIQHYTSTDDSKEEWHGNGITAFTTTDGIPILAITHRSLNECVLLKNPYSLTSEEGGGKIVQRFGRPGYYNANGKSNVQHDFGGIGNDDSTWNGVHNAWYSVAADGTETVTIYVNSDGSDSSHVYNFDLNLKEEDDFEGVIDDTVFDTEWRSVALPWLAGSQGGARPIGPQKEGSRVFVVGSGSATQGIYVVSEDGEMQSCGDGIGPYDSFLRFFP
ncbi:hypothetical protein TrCOL_g7205 [Triparma columacea]|uniref:Fucose-specific lectin n=1 Tax=Triparma columacea TaxID=722753 RepID=A0A9W7FXU3_9STRA|nr:hypothetical protein TrCOL_g7205 [Triparma columacea]